MVPNLNYSRVVQLARGEFFEWASSSDWCASSFLYLCHQELLHHPDAILAVPRTRLFEGTPEASQPYGADIEVVDDTPSARLFGP